MAVELATGYISLVPSAKGFATQASREINPDALGRKLGSDIGDAMQRSIGPRLRDPINTRFIGEARKGGDDAGDAAGRSMADAIESRLSRVDSKKALGHSLSGLAGLAGGLLGGFGAVGAVDLGQQFFEAASNLNESVSKVNVVFGDSASIITAWADTTTKSLGISKQDALEAAGTFGNLFRAMGIGTDQSAEMSKSIINLAGDLASFNNANPEDVLLALRSGLVGETEPLRQFGVNLNEARIKAEALRLGLVRGNVNNVDVAAKTRAVEKAQADENAALKQFGAQSPQYRDAQIKTAQAQQALEKSLEGSNVELDASQKAQAAYSLILQDTTLAQGDAGRTIDQTAGKARVAGATWEDFKGKLGAALLPVATTVLDKIIEALDKIQKWWDEHGPEVMNALDTLGRMFERVGELAEATGRKISEIFGPDPVRNFEIGADTVSTKLDEVFGPDKLANFELGAVVLYQMIGPAWENLGRIIVTEVDRLLWMKDHVLDPIFGSLQEGVPEMLAAFGAVFSFIKEDIFDPVIGVIQTLIDKLREFWDSEFMKTLRSALGLDALVGLLPKILGFDQGGVVPGPRGSAQLAVVHGGETILPTHRTIDFEVDTSALSMPGASGGSSAPYIQTGDIHLHGVTDSDAALQVRHELHKLSLLSGRR